MTKKKVLCIYDVNIPLKVMEKVKKLEKYGYEIQYELDETLSDDISQITERMHLYEQEGITSAPRCRSLIENCDNAEIIIVHCAVVDNAILEKSKNLKILAVLRGGLDNIDINEIERRGIKLIHAPWRSANAVADFTLGMMLAEDKNIARGHYYLKKGIWQRDYVNDSYIRDLNKCTVGIIGFGNIGIRVAQRLKGFESDIIVHDPFISDEKIESLGYRPVSKEELFKRSDIITLHLRQTKDTLDFVDRKSINLMKPEAYIVNTARSGIIQTEALIEALNKKRIGGAAIDVFDQEPLPEDSPFLKLKNVTLTPHIAGYSSDTVINSVEIVLDDLILNEEGHLMENVYKKIK